MGSLWKDDVCRVMESYNGYHEGANNWNIFAQKLDQQKYYNPQTYKNNQPWCCHYINACMMEAAQNEDEDAKKWDAQYFMYQPGYNNLSAVVGYMAQYFIDNDAFYYDDPQYGDIIFFDSVDSDGNVIEEFVHVGWISSVDGCIQTQEGNAGDQVQTKWYDFDQIGHRIHGFGRPRYDGDTNPADIDHKPEPYPDEPVNVELKVLERGSTGGQVNTIKALLNEFGFAEDLPLDGDFDYSTEKAVNKYKETYGLEVNGIVDAEMWNLILK